MATDANKSTFYSVCASDLIGMPIDEAKKLLRNLFDLAKECRSSIIFIDKIDSLCSNPAVYQDVDHLRRINHDLFIQMQTILKKELQGVVILAATNSPWLLDSSFRYKSLYFSSIIIFHYFNGLKKTYFYYLEIVSRNVLARLYQTRKPDWLY